MAISQNPANIVKIGFGSAAYTGYLLQDVGVESVADTEKIIAEGVVKGRLIRNNGMRYTISALTVGIDIDDVPAVGSAFTFTNPSGAEVVLYCTSSSAVATDGATKVSLVGETRDDVTFTA